ncbi:hypothetical protein [Pararhizobium sp.]|uniref:hypothetical protein n=1 Tax=Pararhizobium sp. TaxID=1977563 RepID=UPI00271E6E77|nr:hypothetical protein [Pararhizobium sp.]MDO9418542.1 hypothetical protein [Pararhizobium sp.]
MSLQMHAVVGNTGHAGTHYKHFHVERPGFLLTIGEQLKPKKKYRCLVRHISIGGAMLDFSPVMLVPKNFFVQVEGFSDEIGSTTVYRNGSQLGVRFNMLLAPEFVRTLIRMEFCSGSL